jgi:hypothetical protein
VPRDVDVVVEIVSVEVPVVPDVRVMLEGLSERLGPTCDIVAARLTVPAKPPIDARVMVEVPEEP